VVPGYMLVAGEMCLYRFRLKIILFCGKKAGHIPRHADEGEAMGKKLKVGGPATHEEVDAAYQASQELHEGNASWPSGWDSRKNGRSRRALTPEAGGETPLCGG